MSTSKISQFLTHICQTVWKTAQSGAVIIQES